MNSFADALKGAGLRVKEDVLEINDFDDLKLPYMNITSERDIVTISDYNLLYDCMLIEKYRSPLNVEWFKKNRKPFNNNDDGLYVWVLNHADRCYTINTDHGMIGDCLEHHLNYGMCCMVFYLEWDRVHKCLTLNYGSKNMSKSLFDVLWKTPIKYLNKMLDKCEYIPIYVRAEDDEDFRQLAVVSDTVYSTWVWGQSIIDSDNPDVVKAYKRSIEKGYKINPKGKYYIFPHKRAYYKEGTSVYFRRIKSDEDCDSILSDYNLSLW